MLNEKVKEYFETIDNNQSCFRYGGQNIIIKIQNILKESPSYELTKKDKAEESAFILIGINDTDEESNWRTYHLPPMGFLNDNGVIQYPNINKYVDEEKLGYWKTRAKESKSYFLKSHYADLVVDFSSNADLVVDFSPKITSSGKLDIELIQLVIDSNVSICDDLLLEPLYCQKKIKRALLLSIKIKDRERIRKVKKAIIDLERNTAIDNLMGLWGYSFRWLMLDYSKKVELNKDEKATLINELEQRWERMEWDFYVGKEVVSLLTEYYASKKKEDKFISILDKWAESFKNFKYANSNQLFEFFAYESVKRIYERHINRFSQSEPIKKRINKLLNKINKIDVSQNLKSTLVGTGIKKQDIDDFLKNVFGNNDEYTLDEVMKKTAYNFLIPKKDMKKEMEESKRKYPLQSLSSDKIISNDGILTATIPPSDLKKLSSNDDLSFEENYDINLFHHASETVRLLLIFLNPLMQKFKKRFSKEDIINYFKGALIFQNEKEEYLIRAFTSYWENDYIVSSHLFIPLIESGIRELVKKCDGAILRSNDIDGYDYISLGKLLEKNNEIFKAIYQTIGEDVLFYFRLILTEKAGFNLRNKFAHGLSRNTFFSPEVSDLLFQVLVLLSLIKQK